MATLTFVLLVTVLCSFLVNSNVINCNGAQECYEDTETCQSNEDCTIYCSGGMLLTVIQNKHNKKITQFHNKKNHHTVHTL